ncbi:MAG: HAMP domain-containing histidine kinase [Acholeplasmatales bacterium]|nr:HAMP domain-containing histidine kinase [Acholeplasmatales bacterium]
MLTYRERLIDVALTSYVNTVPNYEHKEDWERIPKSDSFGYFIYDNDLNIIFETDSEDFIDTIGLLDINKLVIEKKDSFISVKKGASTYYMRSIKSSDDQVTYVIFTDNSYLNERGRTFTWAIQLSFVALILLGNVFVLFWSYLTVERIKKLTIQIVEMKQSNYKKSLVFTGADELSNLIRTIENMRQEIEKSNREKEEMLQNISHDLKTPISVIKSYAEAIQDGVEGMEAFSKITTAADNLQIKVKQLIEYTKLEHFVDIKEFENVNISEVLINVINNQKFQRKIKISTDLDDSTYFGIKDNFEIVFNNIIDNALRYSKSKIEISLKNKVLTFYNDGEKISNNMIDFLFQPYAKGNKGQFGLGLAIVHRTLQHFNLSITAKNGVGKDGGVTFTIKPY